MSLREGDRRAGTWTNSWEGIGWLEWKVCLLCYFIIEPRGGVVDTSAKMEGRNILENGYDALVEVYCALLLNRRGVGDMEPHVLCEQILLVYHEVLVEHSTQQCTMNTQFRKSRTPNLERRTLNQFPVYWKVS